MADEKQFTDSQRQFLVVLVTQAWVRIKDDVDMREEAKELVGVLRMIQGADTVLISR